MPSNSFFRATHKLVVKRFEPSVSSESSSSHNMRATDTKAKGKKHSMLTKAILKPFKDLKAKIELKKSRKANKTGSESVVSVPAPSSENALIIQPTASSTAHTTSFKIPTVVIIDGLPESSIERVIRDASVPALQLVHVEEPSVSDSERILRTVFELTIGLRGADQDKIAHLQDQANHWKSTATRSNAALDSMLLEYFNLKGQEAGLQHINRDLLQKQNMLKRAHVNLKAHYTQKRDEVFVVIKHYVTRIQELEGHIRDHQARGAYLEFVLKKCYRFAVSERINADKATASFHEVNALYSDLCPRYDAISIAFYNLHAQVDQLNSAWLTEQAAHYDTRNELALAVQELNVVQHNNHALIYECQRVLTERNEVAATPEQELQSKNSRIAALEAELAALRAEKAHQRKVSDSSATLSTVSSGVLFSSTPSNDGGKPLSPLTPPPSDDEAVDDDPMDVSEDFISKGSILDNLSRPDDALNDNGSGFENGHEAAVDSHNHSSTTSTTTPTILMCYDTDSDDADSEASHSPASPPRMVPSQSEALNTTPTAVNKTRRQSAKSRVIKKPIAPSKRVAPTPKSNESTSRGYAMKEKDLSANSVDIFAPILPAPAGEVTSVETSQVEGAYSKNNTSNDEKKQPPLKTNEKNKKNKEKDCKANKANNPNKNPQSSAALTDIGNTSKGYAMKEAELSGNVVDIFGPLETEKDIVQEENKDKDKIQAGRDFEDLVAETDDGKFSFSADSGQNPFVRR